MESVGITDVAIVGDTRFDRVLQIKAASKTLPLLEAFKQGHKVFVAGSSWSPDEEIFIKFFNRHPDWRLVFAPHVIDEEHLRQIESRLLRPAVRYTQATIESAAKAQVLIVDCFGLLSSIYHCGEVAYVGGGFGVGIHNVLEAAVWGVPVFFGPNNQRFREAQGLKANGGGFEITCYEDFANAMEAFFADKPLLEKAGEAAGRYVQGLAGASQKILDRVSL